MATSFDADKIQRQLRKWQDRLLDLSKSNPMLGLNRSRVSKLRVVRPLASDLLKRLVLDEAELKMPFVRRSSSSTSQQDLFFEERDGTQVRVEPGDVELEATPNELLRRLRRIYDNARTTVEERGVTTLYVTLGTLNWQDDYFGDSVSPLWMIPCQLISKGPNAALRLSVADEEMQLNPSIEYYLRERHKISLPQLPEEPDDQSIRRFLAAVRKAVREHQWVVTEEIWLSTFTFESIVIYQDLKAMAKVAGANPIVASLARASAAPESSEALGDDLDTQPTPDVVPVPVLPTDSSQLEALAYVAKGRHVVIHGPPGTGKSQTIANLIADGLGRNKTVLFVSAKMAALNVVHDRLKRQGLERFCLEAHSTKAGKAKIIDELRRTLDAEPARGAETFKDELATLTRVRQQLNAYVRELHKRREPLGFTIYQAVGRAAKLGQAPDIRSPLPCSDPLGVTRDDLDTCLDALADLGALADVFDRRLHHPWRGFNGTGSSIAQQEAMESDLRLIVDVGRDLLGALQMLAPILAGPSENLTLAELEVLRPALQSLSGLEKLPKRWWDLSLDRLNELTSLCETASSLVAERADKELAYEKLFSLPVREAKDLLSPIQTTFKAWYRSLSPSYWTWRSTVRQHVKPGVSVTIAVLRSLSSLAARLVEIELWLGAHEQELAEEVGRPGLGNPQALATAAAQFRAAALLRLALEAIGREPRGETVTLPVEIRTAAATVASSTPSKHAQVQETLQRIDAQWPVGFVDGIATTQAPISSLVARGAEILSAMRQMGQWTALQRVLQRCQELSLSPFVARMGSSSAALARVAFERRFYTLWASAAIQVSKALVDFTSTRQQDLTEKFRRFDAQTRKAAVKRIQAAASQSAHRVRNARDDLGNAGEVGILRHELQKKKRIKPLRRLFAEIPHVLQALKPCMLMSPISVSTYLKPEAIDFDLVVFDEASQLPTPEAVPSVLRAKQVIVAGDANQLPPTSFFEASLLTEEADDTEEDEMAVEPLESFLDDCVAVVPVFQDTKLRWHYRSRDERLIKFSNHYFYDNRLITFPSVCLADQDRGVRSVYVADGVWDRGRSRTNRAEARRVAQLAVEHFTRYPERSLGVVAMNTYQREAIEDAINDQLQNRPDLQPLVGPGAQEHFFVKSLESVQGDERDTIMISVGYGKDANGALTLNFGPLNMEGGWRRLNVLVTRAKWQTILVTSLRSHELRGVNPQNRGAVALKNFIEYAEQGALLPQDAAVSTEAETNDFEDAVREALLERGFAVDAQVGASCFRIDLAIRDRRDPSRYILGVECDGATYHSSRNARDRDLLRQEILRGMGWRLHRVWSTEWFHDREHAIQSILRSIELAEQLPPDQLVDAPPKQEPNGHANTPSDTGAPGKRVYHPKPPRKYPAGRAYRKHRLQGRRGKRDVLLEDSNIGRLSEDVVAIVETEGPIHKELLTERLKELHRVERAGSNVQANIGKAIRQALRSGQVQRGRNKHFLLQNGKAPSTFRLSGDDVERPLELIADEELERAILYVIEDQFGMLRDQIPYAVARLFDIERLPADGADRLSDLVDGLVEGGQLRLSGPQVYLA